MAEQPYKKSYILLICLALAVSTFIAYEPIRHNDFVGLDDITYISDNPHVKGGITRESVVWAFTTPYSDNWHPLTWLSHMLDCQLFGLNASRHHLTSLFIHIANTLLLFLVLRRMTGAVWPSAFVAAAFALHPLHVESVAWVSERKDVLSGFFWMLTMMAYVWYVEQPSICRYLLIVLTFCLGLLSKSMLVTLPFILLLLDCWPLGRLGEGVNRKNSEPMKVHSQWPVFYRLVWEKAPFFVLSAISSAIAFMLQQSAMTPTEELPAKICIANAFISYIKYIGKMLWPSRLAVLYPHPGKAVPMWQAVISALLLLAISICVVQLARKYKYLLVGWLWYLGTLVPVIGIVQVGLQAIADRYTYLPSIGIFIMVAWGAAEVGTKWHFQKLWFGISAGLVLAVLLIYTRMQVRYWQDSLTLYKHAAEVTENNFSMHTLYGETLFEKGEFDEAIMHFKEALRINPRYPRAGIGLGKVLLRKGNFDEAVRCLNAALLTKEDSPDVYGDMGLAYARLYKDELAVANLIKSIELDPNSAENLNNLAWILATTKDTKLQNPTDAVKYAQKACELAGPADQPAFLDTLAAAYASSSRFKEAVETAEKAIKLAEDANEENLAEEIQERLNLYKSDQPYRHK